MELLLISGMVVCAWVFLCVLSGERQKQVWELETKQRHAAMTALAAERKRIAEEAVAARAAAEEAAAKSRRGRMS